MKLNLMPLSSSDELTGLFLGAVASPQSRPLLHPVRLAYEQLNPAQVFGAVQTQHFFYSHMNRKTVYAALKRLEAAGLIHIEQKDGRSPIVTLLEPPEVES